ncbi:unnamed protein product [Acanthoscelides obtectus]|uniref:Adenylate kinase n=1 Tax=Acanthoscelides obtectus TaxID=200917 RepID=A0A9P0PM64_ACAOB|nr:unnamed protein product [Acanthoscelides obtectus]CAK1642059.1 UMP-CMP kinase [Acanthoscelides obtectus]
MAEPSSPPRPLTRTIHPAQVPSSQDRPHTQVISVHPGEGPSPPAKTATTSRTPKTSSQGMLQRHGRGAPSALWVIGGPGSNKATLCASAARDIGWGHASLGRALREAVDTATQEQRRDPEIKKIRECISNGEMVPKDIIMKFINNLMNENTDKEGIIIDGFPRDMDQAREFEMKVGCIYVFWNNHYLYF